MNNGTTETHESLTTAIGPFVENVKETVEDGLERTKVKLGDVRDKADLVVHERPILTAAAVGLVGVGIGYLIANRLERWLVMGIGGAALTAFLAPTLKQWQGRVGKAANKGRHAKS